jgi:transcription elongation factor GreA
MEKILLTRAGYEKLLLELELLSQVERPHLVSEVLESAADGRVEKNQDFQAALARRVRLDRRIHQLQQILANAEVLVGSNLPPDRVRFNSRVKVMNLATGRELEFKVVGTVEADLSQGFLSAASPLGRALLGRVKGDRVELQTPGGLRTYEVREIQVDPV